MLVLKVEPDIITSIAASRLIRQAAILMMTLKTYSFLLCRVQQKGCLLVVRNNTNRKNLLFKWDIIECFL